MADPSETVHRAVRVIRGVWDIYAAVCDEQGVTPSDDLRAHMRRVITDHGTDEQIRALLVTEAEAEARRVATNRVKTARARAAQQRQRS